MAVIEDPSSGRTAEVGADRRLKTRAIATEEATNVSLADGQYYVVCNGAYHQTYAGWHLWMKNNSVTQNCLIQSIHFSCSETGYWMMGKNGATPTGGTEIAPVNFNLSSANTAPLICYYGNGSALSFSTAPTMMTGGLVAANTKWIEPFNGALILGSNTSLGVLWRWSGTSGTVAIGIQFFMEDI